MSKPDQNDTKLQSIQIKKGKIGKQPSNSRVKFSVMDDFNEYHSDDSEKKVPNKPSHVNKIILNKSENDLIKQETSRGIRSNVRKYSCPSIFKERGRGLSTKKIKNVENDYSKLEMYVAMKGGKRIIRSILIANNGIAAVKCMRSIRKWAYEVFNNDRYIKFIAMVTPDDLKANADFIRMADHFLPVPGGSNVNNYASIECIVKLAIKANVDAVFAGWGHASENPRLPAMLDANGIIFIGPHTNAMWSLGDKIASTIIAQSCGVPTLPWSGSDVFLSEDIQNDREKHINVPMNIFDKALVKTPEEAVEIARKIKIPVMIKASEGGGGIQNYFDNTSVLGKGIRMVNDLGDIPKLFRQVLAECPTSPIFVMKLAENVRHLEIQLLADQYGNVISLFGRDCSVQRRHQKIIEEAPISVASLEIQKKMEIDSIRLAKLVGYVSAGTVEFLYDIKAKKYFFLELNPRLQVEHPCTEMVTLVNLPAAQLHVAMGIPLKNIRDIRQFFGCDPDVDTDIDFSIRPIPCGFVMAARITCENPEEGFQPSSGRVHDLNFKSSRDAWGYFSVSSSGSLHEYADSQFGHIFAWGNHREEARQGMVLALKEFSILSDFRTTVEYLISLFEEDSFQDNKIDTGWLDGFIRLKLKSEKPDPLIATVCTALHIAFVDIQLKFQIFKDKLEKGQICGQETISNCKTVDLEYDGYKYNIMVAKISEYVFFVILNDSIMEVNIHKVLDGGLLLTINKCSHMVYVKECPTSYVSMINNKTCVFMKAMDPSLLMSPTTGKLVRYLVEDGDHVNANDVYAEVEVMKMIMELKVVYSGLIHYVKREGVVVENSGLIATLTLDDPTTKSNLEVYKEKFPLYMTMDADFGGVGPKERYERIFNLVKQTLYGYHIQEPYCTNLIVSNIHFLGNLLLNPSLPILELNNVIYMLNDTMQTNVLREVYEVVHTYQRNFTSVMSDFPVEKIVDIIKSYCSGLNSKADQTIYLVTIENLRSLLVKYECGLQGFMRNVFKDLLEIYYEIQVLFQKGQYDRCVSALREKFDNDLEVITKYIFAHSKVKQSNMCVLALIDFIQQFDPESTEFLKDTLNKITTLCLPENRKVALRARELLFVAFQPKYEVRHNNVESILLNATSCIQKNCKNDILRDLVVSENGIYDVLTDFFYHRNSLVRMAALEVYIRRSYIAYDILSIQHYRVNEHSFEINLPYNSNCPTPSNYADKFTKLQIKSFCYTDRYKIRKGSSSNTSYDSETDNFVLEFQLVLPITHPNISATSNSPKTVVTLPPLTPQMGEAFSYQIANLACDRIGLICAFTSYQDFEQSFHSIVSSGDSSIDIFDEFSQTKHYRSKSSSNIFSRKNSTGVYSPPYTSGDNRFNISDSSNRSKLQRNYKRCKRSKTVGCTGKNCTSHSTILNTCEEEGCRIISASISFDPRVNSTIKEDEIFDDNYFATLFGNFCEKHAELLKNEHVRRITFIIINQDSYPLYFTYRNRLNFREDKIYRNLEPALAFQLEINRLSSFNIDLVPIENHRMHIYQGSSNKPDTTDYRYFVRAIIRHCNLTTRFTSLEYLKSEGERMVLEALDALELAISRENSPHRFDCNHIFLNFVPTLVISDVRVITDTVHDIVLTYGARLWKQRILQSEIKFNVKLSEDSPTQVIRVTIANEKGYRLEIVMYREVFDSDTNSYIYEPYFTDDEHAFWRGVSTSLPYPTRDKLQMKRLKATNLATTYCYDFIDMFRQSLLKLWNDHATYLNKFVYMNHYIPKIDSFSCLDSHSPLFNKPPNIKSEYLIFSELTVNSEGNLIEIEREHGNNTIGMVAWKLFLKTPEYPDGRTIIVIANDITTEIGSFGLKEDELFLKVSEYAREMGIPRIYLSCNSGARIGLADEFKDMFKVLWVDENNPEKGFKYLYLTEDDYNSLPDKSIVNIEKIAPTENSPFLKFKIVDIIGSKDGLGIENLRGSATIATETSKAYDEIVTISVVTCRSIGIGAYLVRLGQRVIQVENSHIILTGFGALNKLLGKNVYSSNNQLGGIHIMHNNGVTHAVAENDLNAIFICLKWLSYIPCDNTSSLPIMDVVDQIDREIDFIPTKNLYDPRHLLIGRKLPGKDYQSGIFDHNSYIEIMDNWAKTVICGRARLGGIPVGVIITETRSISLSVPADPADMNSEETKTAYAGQVWFPDSAFKTAQTVLDFNRERLPLFIFANWRGFSGGMKDMYEQILKFGSKIVDALRLYKQPIFVYLSPFSELRGGAWVVLDSSINPDFMEMYADENSRGSVLEPEGMVSIKYREREIMQLIDRLDPHIKKMKIDKEKSVSECENDSIMNHKNSLIPTYQQIAVTFADLHDKPGRMMAKKVINGIIEWKNSRKFFYWRLRRKLYENELIKQLIFLPFSDAKVKMTQFITNNYGEEWMKKNWNNDELLCNLYANDGMVGGSFEEFLPEIEVKSVNSFSLNCFIKECKLQHQLKEIDSLLIQVPQEKIEEIFRKYKV
ncbi:hypothetical protein A3Q56_00089 [Intoshia linei]|uniref:Uncharacterized protein n=1 Tax=Intoshia linei TaxID=1819745 RepID=A0A177BCW9_9BILA|nr:hypothetical protein A3Q56_00089 [Intoshia linei]